MIDRSTIRRSRENSRYSNNATCMQIERRHSAVLCTIYQNTPTRIYNRIDRPIPKHAWVDGQFDRLLIPNSGAFDLIKVKSRHWPQWGGYPCYNDRRIMAHEKYYIFRQAIINATAYRLIIKPAQIAFSFRCNLITMIINTG